MHTRNFETLEVAKICSTKLIDNLTTIETGDYNDELKENLLINIRRAARVLENVFLERAIPSTPQEEEIFSDAESDLPESVHEWITSTFTRRVSTVKAPRRRLRSLVNAVRAGIMFDRIYRRLSLGSDIIVPPSAVMYLKEELDSWHFDIYRFDELCDGHSLKVMGYELLYKHNIIDKFGIDTGVLDNFLTRMEEGYSKHMNPYHNLVHAADVSQTCFSIINQAKLATWLTDLEVFALVFAAVIHDYEHTGTTNAYQVMTHSELALIYNDRSVLESFHVSKVFTIMKEDEYNILSSLTKEEYKEFRGMVIEMVLATDMTVHFSQVQSIRDAIMLPENLQKIDILSFIIHSADISHPCKSWELHHRWTKLLVEEFFFQGDQERAMDLPCSPLCDRHTTMVPQSQIGFINIIVEPCFNVLGDMLDSIGPLFFVGGNSMESAGRKGDSKNKIIITKKSPAEKKEEGSDDDSSDKDDNSIEDEDSERAGRPRSPTPNRQPKIDRPWSKSLHENKKMWTELSGVSRNIDVIKEEEETDNNADD